MFLQSRLALLIRLQGVLRGYAVHGTCMSDKPNLPEPGKTFRMHPTNQGKFFASSGYRRSLLPIGPVGSWVFCGVLHKLPEIAP